MCLTCPRCIKKETYEGDFAMAVIEMNELHPSRAPLLATCVAWPWITRCRPLPRLDTHDVHEQDGACSEWADSVDGAF